MLGNQLSVLECSFLRPFPEEGASWRPMAYGVRTKYRRSRRLVGKRLLGQVLHDPLGVQ